jgi:hypothetical protein
LRNKKREYLKAEINELATNRTNKNIRDLYRGINEYKNAYQLRVLSHDISNTWKNYFSRLQNMHGDSDVRQVEMHAAGILVPESTPIEVETSIEDVNRYKSPGIDQIPAELIQAGGDTSCSEIQKLVSFIWNKKEFPDQWKESIIVKLTSSYRGISLSSSYKILSSILPYG